MTHQYAYMAALKASVLTVSLGRSSVSSGGGGGRGLQMASQHGMYEVGVLMKGANERQCREQHYVLFQ
jgi:hypothetical protein